MYGYKPRLLSVKHAHFRFRPRPLRVKLMACKHSHCRCLQELKEGVFKSSPNSPNNGNLSIKEIIIILLKPLLLH